MGGGEGGREVKGGHFIVSLADFASEHSTKAVRIRVTSFQLSKQHTERGRKKGKKGKRMKQNKAFRK